MSKPRHGGIDALRGLAVLVMIGANMTPYLLERPHPLWFRVWSSAAAPVFILLAGFMAGAGAGRPVSGVLKRSVALLGIAAALDYFCWKVTPFVGFDVLYLIAFALPLAHLLRRLPVSGQLVAVAGPFVAAPVLQGALDYGSVAENPALDSLQTMFVDGWFPVCPWLGVCLLGAFLGGIRARLPEAVFVRRLLRWGLTLAASGACLWLAAPPELRVRGGYAELFYPPTTAFMLVSMGGVMLLLTLSLRMEGTWIQRALSVFGRRSLFLYIAHIVVIVAVLKPNFSRSGMDLFLAVYAVHTLVLWGMALAMQQFLPKPSGFWGRLLLGG